jgi:hypothetical protein
MVFNATFNNISVIYMVASVLLVEENRSAWRKPPTCCKSPTNFKKKMLYGVQYVEELPLLGASG